MYKLYYAPGACSMAIHVALLECNQQITLQKIDIFKGEGQNPDYLKINPRGQVPTLDDDGFILREGASILMYILDKHQSPLLPRGGKERAAALDWLMFCNASLHPAYGRTFFLVKNAGDPAKQQLLEISVKMINKMWNVIEEQLSKTAYLCGSEISMADILLTVIANWSKSVPVPIVLGPKTKKLLQTVIARPAYKKALEVEQVEYKMAA